MLRQSFEIWFNSLHFQCGRIKREKKRPSQRNIFFVSHSQSVTVNNANILCKLMCDMIWPIVRLSSQCGIGINKCTNIIEKKTFLHSSANLLYLCVTNAQIFTSDSEFTGGKNTAYPHTDRKGEGDEAITLLIGVKREQARENNEHDINDCNAMNHDITTLTHEKWLNIFNFNLLDCIFFSLLYKQWFSVEFG